MPEVLPVRTVAVVAHRLGGTDGIAAASAVWQDAFRSLGCRVVTVAGEGRADRLVGGLAYRSTEPPDTGELANALEDADVVVVENCCSAPRDTIACDALGRVLRGRPAILRHHDLAWQRRGHLDDSPPPSDPAWRQVTINERSRLELEARGIPATAIYHHFDVSAPHGDRDHARELLGIGPSERLLLQPTRAVPTKNVPGGLVASAALQATYWLTGPAEDGFGPELSALERRAPVRMIVGKPDSLSLADAYAACDAVVLPSTWEGFGSPAIESAVHARPLLIAPYPVSAELRRYGFSWFDTRDTASLARHLASPDAFVTERNAYVAGLRFSAEELPDRLRELLTSR